MINTPGYKKGKQDSLHQITAYDLEIGVNRNAYKPSLQEIILGTGLTGEKTMLKAIVYKKMVSLIEE